jgi:hypothetical protein
MMMMMMMMYLMILFSTNIRAFNDKHLSISEAATSELEDHVDCAAWFEVVVGDHHLIGQLLSSKDQSDLVDHDTFFLLEGLFNLQDSVVRVEVEALLSSCQSLLQTLVKEMLRGHTLINSCMILVLIIL